MSIHTRTGNQTAGTTRVWKWNDTAKDPMIIPDSWAQAGGYETADNGEEQFFAVEVRFGILLEYDTNSAGEAAGVANRERPGIRTLYVSEDGGRAIVVESQAERSGSSITPREDWASIITRPAGAGDEVDAERRDAYRSLIRDLYEVDN
ncbi:hypothetical protein [Haloarcula rubra]|nr:hypothetical protein [Halomicroarcula rubra]